MGPIRKQPSSPSPSANSFFQLKKSIAKSTTHSASNGNSVSKSTITYSSVSEGVKWSIEENLIRSVYTPKEEATDISTNVDTQSASQPATTRTIAIAAFDLDSTLITTKGKNRFSKNPSDWRWLHSSIEATLKDIITLSRLPKTPTTALPEFVDSSIQYHIIIISNQGSVVANKDYKSFINLRDKINSIAKTLNIPIRFYAAAKAIAGVAEKYRKPQSGIWQALTTDLTLSSYEIDINKSFYVGDAAGRPHDFSDSDLKFAEAIGVKFFTPEEFFNITEKE